MAGGTGDLVQAKSSELPLVRVHQVEEDSRRNLLQLLQNVLCGWEGDDLQRWEKTSLSNKDTEAELSQWPYWLAPSFPSTLTSI